MNAIELLDIISTGETSKVQFKETLPNPESVSREMVAMANSLGGMILLGVKDKVGTVTGLTQEQIEYADRKVAEFADNLKPPIYLSTEVVKIDEDSGSKNVLIIHINEGINKPYKTGQGEIYVKQGSNKRLLTDNAEIMRLFQHSGNLLADEMEVHGTSIEDVDEKRFSEYFKKEFDKTFEERGLTFEQALRAKRVLRNNQLTLAGLLFFGKDPQVIKPAFTIKAVSYYGNDLEAKDYRSKPSDFRGTIPDLFEQGMAFLKENLAFLQSGESFNSKGQLEISPIALEELLQNALVHRDYFKNSPIRLLIFDNRIEIISPGKLPNSLTVEDIKFGNPVIRNNQLVAFSTHTLPFSGLGSGVKRALAEQPDIELINDIEGEQFKVIIPRLKKKDTSATTISSTSNIERQLISLKSGIPHDIFVKNGFDYYNSYFHIRYPISAFGKKISVSLKNANGHAVSETIELKDEGHVSFHFSADISSLNLERNFGFMEITAPEDLNLEIWSETVEGGFL